MKFKNYLKNELFKASITEKGVKFQTGTPVTFNYMRNTQKSPNMGTMFGQNIEPAGKYMLHNTHNTDSEALESLRKAGWETGTISFKNPLVIELSADYDDSGLPQNVYGEKGWKQRLHDYYGKIGSDLNKALRADGFDGIVTTSGYDTREIVDLTFGKNDVQSSNSTFQ